ncbi:MAG: isoaspartyl peptidase/L-asparaginase [Fimbriimonadaceae bacterium]|nr:isoaspartyl peptidase/L-asparaginase [Fimbriimonadaceae bacterium]
MRAVLSTWNEPGEVAIRSAVARLQAGGSMLDALEAGLVAAEDDPHLVAIGRGALPNSEGVIELDASVMVGSDLTAGSVCALQGILPAITVARWVMERTPHVMIAGQQAKRFAEQHGLKEQCLDTAESRARFAEYLERPEVKEKYVHTAHDTVTVLGNQDGKVTAASSTSGLGFKVPGRVGDSPIVGSGIYADDEAGCAGATGWGEQLWRACASYRTVRGMASGMSAQEACDETVRYMLRRLPGSREMACAVMAIARDGNFGAAVTQGTFPYWSWTGGEPQMHECSALEA